MRAILLISFLLLLNSAAAVSWQFNSDTDAKIPDAGLWGGWILDINGAIPTVCDISWGDGFVHNQITCGGDCPTFPTVNAPVECWAQADFNFSPILQPAAIKYRTIHYKESFGYGTDEYFGNILLLDTNRVVMYAYTSAWRTGVNDWTKDIRWLCSSDAKTTCAFDDTASNGEPAGVYFTIQKDWIESVSLFSLHPDVNVWNFITNLTYFDGTNTLDFNVHHFVEGTTITLKLGFSDANHPFAFQNIITDNLILNGFASADDNLSCTDSNWAATQSCSYSNPVAYMPDGNWVFDFNFSDGDKNTWLSSNWFIVDLASPSTSWDGNTGWQSGDANIHLIYNGAGAKASTKYRLDTDPSKEISFGAWQAYDKNIFIAQDGNWAIDFNSTDVQGRIGDVNRQFVLVDKTAPVISNNAPYGDISQAGLSFSWVFSINDSGSAEDGNCDYNVESFDPTTGLWSPFAGYQNKTTDVINSECVVSFSVSVSAGTAFDVNAFARDVFFQSNPIRSFSITYAPSGGLPPAGGGGGGAPSLSGEGGFCITSNDCLLNLVCDNFSCRRIAGLEDMNLVFVLPREITSSPFEDVLPASKITLSNISVVNRSDVPIDLDLFFACSGSDHCAKDWCVLKEADRSFVLQGQGVKILSAECEIPSVGALIGETYFTQLVAQSKRTKVSRSSSIIIPLQKAIIPADYRVYLAAGKSVLNYGLVCFGNSKVDCALRLGEQPIQFAGVELNLEVWTVAAIAAVVLLVLFTHWAWFALFIVVVVLRFALG